MSNERLDITIYYDNDNEKFSVMDIHQELSHWCIESDLDGDVQIECSTVDGSHSLILNQEELKQFIQFLQSKVK